MLRPKLPDPGTLCCYGIANGGPQACTCWEAVYDQPQAPPPGAVTAPATRATRCDDCAFRPDSPEAQGDPRYAHSTPEEFDAMVEGDGRFFCHQGMRRLVAWRHPSGLEVPARCAGEYRPPVVDDVALKADGTTADLCAGWARAKAEAAWRNS